MRRRCSLVSLGNASGGRQHTRSSSARCSASMVSLMAVETFTAYPLWYTVSSLMVFATRPPMTTFAKLAGTAPGMQYSGAAYHRGVGAL